jgi:hypothetical protein
MTDAIGWVATAIFSSSYFFRGAAALRRIQAMAGCVWATYGVAIHSWPVIISNVIVVSAALWTLWSARTQD